MARFRLKPLFLEVIRSVEGINQKKNVFTYQEICKTLSQYIISRRDTLFDAQNVKLAIVKDDLLGQAFNVSHSSNVKSMD